MNNKLDITEYQFKGVNTAIELFSQILSIEQICTYGFEFVVDTLKLTEAAIYILDENDHILKNQTTSGRFKASEKHSLEIDKIATLYGRTLTKNFSNYFSNEFIKDIDYKFILPIIVKSKVHGFIVASKVEKEFENLITLEFIEEIKKIFNISVYIAINDNKNIILKKEIDKKMFNLSFVNQSTKLLFSELELEKLYQLCIDMIRELTSSSVTSFSLYDEGRSKLVLKGFNDILNFGKFYLEIAIKNLSPNTERTVFHIKDDAEILSEIFDDISDFKKLSAEYIVLLKKDEIIGVATVGLPVNGKTYDKQTLSQIESLSASIYISMMNALYVEEINMQKMKIEKQLNSIGKLNRIIKNINSCESLEEMMEISSETFELSYGVNKGAIFVRNNNHKFELIKGIGFENNKKIELGKESYLCQIDEFYFNFDYSKASKYVDDFLEYIGDKDERNCMIISPIKLDIFELDGNGILGYIVIWNASHTMKSNELVCIETLSNSMAPVVRQFIVQNEKMKVMSFDQRKLFVNKNDEMALNKYRYNMDYKVYYQFIHCELFDEIDLSPYDGLDFFYFSCLLVYPVYDGEDIDESLFEGYVEGDSDRILEKLGMLHQKFVEILAGS